MEAQVKVGVQVALDGCVWQKGWRRKSSNQGSNTRRQITSVSPREVGGPGHLAARALAARQVEAARTVRHDVALVIQPDRLWATLCDDLNMCCLWLPMWQNLRVRVHNDLVGRRARCCAQT